MGISGASSERTPEAQSPHDAATIDSAAGAASVLGLGEAADRNRLPDPHRIGRYIVLNRLGEGGMGTVYAAYDTELDRKVAIKVVRTNRAEYAQGRVRVLREAQAMAQVSHPNVVHVYEVGESLAPEASETSDSAQGHVFIAMEFIAGTTLHVWQSQGGRTYAEILMMYLQAGEGLIAAHRSGLIHRDFKPDNVLVSADGLARVVDFGLARPAKQSLPPSERAPDPIDSMDLLRPLSLNMTEAGTILGTPGYMSPEQYRGATTDEATDQFSFCAALYGALYKQAPFAGTTRAALGENVIAGRVRSPPANEVPLEITQAIIRGLALDPAHRFPSMRELLNALVRGLHPNADTAAAKNTRRWFAQGFALLVLLVSIPAFLRKETAPSTIQEVFVIAIIMNLCAGGVTFFVRKHLMKHPEHRSLVLLLHLTIFQLFLARGSALFMGSTLSQYLPIDCILITGFMSIAAYRFMPKLWLGVALLLMSAGLLLLFPVACAKLPIILYPIITFMYVRWWPSLPPPSAAAS